MLQAVLLYYFGDLLMGFGKQGHRGAEQSKVKQMQNVNNNNDNNNDVHTIILYIQVCTYCTKYTTLHAFIVRIHLHI